MSINKAQYTIIHYSDRNIKSLKELFDKEKIVNINYKDFLNMESPYNNIKNREALFTAYTEQQKNDLGLNSADDIKETTEIHPPATLYITKSNVKTFLISNEQKFVKEEDYNSFVGKEVSKILNNPEFRKDEVIKGYPEISCYVWCKALHNLRVNSKGEDEVVIGKIINLSKFIQNAKINVSPTGGNFSIELPSIPAEEFYELSDNERAYKSWDYNRKDIIHTDNSLVVKTQLHKSLDRVSGVTVGSSSRDIQEIRTVQFPMVAISTNDIVFIKFEKLEMETQDIVKSFELHESQLPGNVFDMIGLIDNVTVSTSYNNISITLQGRDIMKLILDDGSFFFYNSYTNPSSKDGIFMNETEGNGDVSSVLNVALKDGWSTAGRFFGDGRRGGTGIVMGFFNPSMRTIKNIIDTVIRQLANIQICPDSLFDYYGDRRSRYLFESKNKQANKSETKTSEEAIAVKEVENKENQNE